MFSNKLHSTTHAPGVDHDSSKLDILRNKFYFLRRHKPSYFKIASRTLDQQKLPLPD